MDSSAIVEWLKEEFSSRFQQKESECLTTLVWFDQNRYWLRAVPRLVEESVTWNISPKEGTQVPLKIVAVGPDKGRSATGPGLFRLRSVHVAQTIPGFRCPA